MKNVSEAVASRAQRTERCPPRRSRSSAERERKRHSSTVPLQRVPTFSGGGLVSERACERSVMDDAASAATPPRPENPPRGARPERTAVHPDLNADTLRDGIRPAVTARGGSAEGLVGRPPNRR